MTPEEWEWTLDAMEQDERKQRRRYRAKAWRVLLCLLACFWIAAVAGCVSVWPVEVIGGSR